MLCFLWPQDLQIMSYCLLFKSWLRISSKFSWNSSSVLMELFIFLRRPVSILSRFTIWEKYLCLTESLHYCIKSLSCNWIKWSRQYWDNSKKKCLLLFAWELYSKVVASWSSKRALWGILGIDELHLMFTSISWCKFANGKALN